MQGCSYPSRRVKEERHGSARHGSPSEPIPTTMEEPPPTVYTQTEANTSMNQQRKIAQINCNGFMARMTELKNWIHRQKPLAILLQETLLKEGQSVTPPSGYREAGRKDGKPYPPSQPAST